MIARYARYGRMKGIDLGDTQGQEILKGRKAYILGGQPGSGKSNYFIDNPDAKNCIILNGDDYRKFHPKYDNIIANEQQDMPRACLKNHSYHLHNDAYASYSPLCEIFAPNSVNIARYASFIWHKSPTNCDAHLAESIFQTRSKIIMQQKLVK